MARLIQKQVQLLKKNPIKKVRSRYPNDPLTQEEVNKLVAGITSLRDKTLLILGLNTGMRISEIVNIPITALKWQEGTIDIWDEKKNIYRNIMPSMETMSCLKLYISERTEKSPNLFQFSTKTGENIIQRWTTKLLGKTRSWHAIRHTYVSLSREKGEDIKVVMDNTGDAAETILRYYTQISPKFRRENTEKHPIWTAAQ